MLKTREVTIFSGHRFAVPQNVQRIDTRSTHGWQVRYGGTKMFSDGTPDGSGAAASLDKATKELLNRILTLPAPTKLQLAPSANKSSKLPVGISGPVVRLRSGSVVQHCSIQVLLPQWGKPPRNRNIYIGSEATYTQKRFKAALAKAVELRKAAEEAYRLAETKARRSAAKAMKDAMKSGSLVLAKRGKAPSKAAAKGAAARA